MELVPLIMVPGRALQGCARTIQRLWEVGRGVPAEPQVGKQRHGSAGTSRPTNLGPSFFRYALLAWLSLGSVFTGMTQEFRAFWADAFHAGFKTPEQVTQLIADIRAANCNAVVVEVRKRGDAYYISHFEPRATDIAIDFDPLQDLINKAHDTNAGPRIDVHAWLVTFPIWSSQTTPPIQPDHPFNLHPDWLTQTQAGTQWAGSYYVFDPGHPAVQEHTYNVAMDIVEQYEIDGLNFDYIRYCEATATANNNPWGYNPVSVARFNALSGRSGVPAPNDAEWLAFRRNQITALLRKIYLGTMALRPSVKVSADTITWAPGVTNEIEWLSSGPYGRVLQDWRAWMEEGIMDLNIQMCYFRQNTSYATDYAKWSQFAKDHRYNRQVAIGPGLYLNSISNGIYQMRATRTSTAAGNRADGVCGYSYAVPASNTIANLQTTFFAALTQPSVYDAITPPIFERPTPVPTMTWKTTPTRGHLRGFVFQAGNSNVFDGLPVMLTGATNKTMVTDGTGFYGAVDLEPGNYVLSVVTNGYATVLTNVVITVGTVTSQNFLLQPLPPAIVVQPQHQTAQPGSTVAFSVQATGGEPLVCSWLKDGHPIPWARGFSLTLTNVQMPDAGAYSAIVSNQWGTACSSNALLTVRWTFANLTVTPGSRAAIVCWSTAEPASSQVEYFSGTNPHLFTALDPEPVTQHSVLVAGLTPETQYSLYALSRYGSSEYRSEVLYFTTAGSLIVDNIDASFSGAWTASSSSSDKYLGDYRYASTVTGAATRTATFTPVICTPGLYDVYVWYPQGGNRSALAPHTIFFNGGSYTTNINQQINGGGWRLLAAGKPFAAGTNGYVEIANNTGESGKVVMADAIRFVYTPNQDICRGNTVPQWWSQHYFGLSVNALLDPDGDGYPTWMEYLAGTNPTNAGSHFDIRLECAQTPRILVSPFFADRLYQLQCMTNCSSSWEIVTNQVFQVLSNGQGAINLPPLTGQQKLYRLKIDWPE